jgi:hypothetical protein
MPAEELYDLDTDPYEIQNLAESSEPEHQAVLKRLRAELERWIDESNDQGRTPEPLGVAAAKGATRPVPGASPTANAKAKAAAKKKVRTQDGQD